MLTVIIMNNHLQYMCIVYDSQAMYTTVQQIKIVIHTTCMNLEGIVLSERTWYQKVTAEGLHLHNIQK